MSKCDDEVLGDVGRMAGDVRGEGIVVLTNGEVACRNGLLEVGERVVCRVWG